MKAYDHVSRAYSTLFDWENRFKREEPLFRHLFHEHMVKSLLDLGCGSGSHSNYWADIGYNVVGIDSSGSMIAEARKRAEEEDLDVEYHCRSITEYTSAIDQQFDAVVCMGNTLPHILEPARLSAFFAEMEKALKFTGVGIIHLTNFRRILQVKKRDLPVLTQVDEQGNESLFCRFYDFHPHRLEFNMVLVQKTPEGWHSSSSQVLHYPWMVDDLVTVAKEQGFSEIMTYGDFNFGEFDLEESDDLILVLEKGETD